MQELTFDENGYLNPYAPIEVDLETFKTVFVDNFPNSTRRSILFDNYLKFLYSFQDEIFTFFEQWIDGSFVTMKENPKDIDVVTFLHTDVWSRRNSIQLDKFWSFSLEDQFIDSYLVEEFPKNHPNYGVLELEKSNWSNRYLTDRAKQPKGFLKLIFEK